MGESTKFMAQLGPPCVFRHMFQSNQPTTLWFISWRKEKRFLKKEEVFVGRSQILILKGTYLHM